MIAFGAAPFVKACLRFLRCFLTFGIAAIFRRQLT
jgi:hypothetical protein